MVEGPIAVHNIKCSELFMAFGEIQVGDPDPLLPVGISPDILCDILGSCIGGGDPAAQFFEKPRVPSDSRSYLQDGFVHQFKPQGGQVFLAGSVDLDGIGGVEYLEFRGGRVRALFSFFRTSPKGLRPRKSPGGTLG